MTGWDGELNHEEWLLAGLGVIGIGGAIVSLRWKRLFILLVAMGGIVLFYALRAILQKFQNLRLYTETRTYGDDPVVFILGAEPFLLIAVVLLPISAGIAGLRQHTDQEKDETPPVSTAA